MLRMVNGESFGGRELSLYLKIITSNENYVVPLPSNERHRRVVVLKMMTLISSPRRAFRKIVVTGHRKGRSTRRVASNWC